MKKDLVLEWRQKYALSAILLYLVSTVYLCYLSFIKLKSLPDIVWNTLFWVIIVFSAFNTITKSFISEKSGRQMYYFQLVRPEALILAKIAYNILLMLFLSVAGFGVYCMFLGYKAQDLSVYFLSLFLGSVGFSSILTLMAAIAAKAENAGMLMAILSFPLILPMIIMLNRLTKNALDGLQFSASFDEISTLLGIDLIVIALSYILFPYLWKS